MIITQRADYAFRIVLYLSKQPLERSFPMQMLSEMLKIPPRYSTTILQKLAQAKIVKSRRGLYGGYALAREGAEITYLDVFEAVEGSLHVTPCLTQEGYCTLHTNGPCEVHENLTILQKMLRKDMSTFTF